MDKQSSEKRIADIIKLKKSGMRQVRIASLLKIGEATVSRILAKADLKKESVVKQNPNPVYTDVPETIKEEKKMEITNLEIPKKEIKADIDAKFAEIDTKLKKIKEDMLTLFQNQKDMVEYLKNA